MFTRLAEEIEAVRGAGVVFEIVPGGSDQHGTLPKLDWELYMAVSTMETITSTLTALGRDVPEPALIVERCGVADEQMVAGRLGDIAERARRADVRAPA